MRIRLNFLMPFSLPTLSPCRPTTEAMLLTSISIVLFNRFKAFSKPIKKKKEQNRGTDFTRLIKQSTAKLKTSLGPGSLFYSVNLQFHQT